MSLRDLDDLGFFLIVSRHPSLASAALELGASVAQLSKRMSKLERRLGTRLATRSSRGLRLTEEGERFAAGAQDIRRQVEELELSVADASSDLTGTVSVLSTPGIGRAHIGPLLAEVAREHPGLALRLELDSVPVGADLSGCDLAIRIGTQRDSRLHARKVADNRRVLCASPDYLARHRSPRRPADLKEHECLVLRENESDFAIWRFLSVENGKEESVAVSGALASNDGDVVTQWACDGHGIMRRSSWQVGTLLETGELVEVMPRFTTPSDPVFALHPAVGDMPRRVRAVLDQLVAGLSARIDGPR